ncbi:MAG: hypothetical protein LBG47_03060 [Prevotellaceae bacterium]|jgi:hypothetical protein|nr:hypothetical protein [Prevotellaceae bacterium]
MKYLFIDSPIAPQKKNWPFSFLEGSHYQTRMLYTALGIVLCKNSAQMAQIFMIYADAEKAKICANHKNLRHLCAKKQIAAFGRAEYSKQKSAIILNSQLP